jgi:tetratricopeptide (TPR) repeat protein
VQEEEMALFTLLLTRSLSADREATLPLLRRVFSLRQPFFAFTEAYPENQLRILLEAGNCNTIFMMMRWHSHRVSALPPFLPPFLEAVERAGREAGDTALLACAAYLQDQERFEGLVAGLPVDEWNYRLVGGSSRDYRRAVSWLLESPQVASWQVNEAVGICRMQGDFSLAGSLLERYGLLDEAARHYREGGLFPQALALFRKLGDEPNQARMHERLEEWEQALAIWRKRHRPRDVQRVLKQQAKTRKKPKKPKKPKPEIQEKTASQRELF